VAELRKHLKQAVKKIEAAGVKTVGIGITTDAVRDFYQKNIVINKIADLPGSVVRELRHLLIA
jgi:cobalamin biosynthesis protein CobT